MNEPTPAAEKDAKPSFMRRISIAFGAFFRSFSDAEFARRVDHIDEIAAVAEVPRAEPAPPEPPKPVVLREASPDAALQLLSLLQRDARLIDFAMEDLSAYSDQDIGAAARVVHEGCRKVLKEHFTIVPVRSESEGSRVTLAEGFDAASVQLTGNVVGSAPFNGSLTHRGWRASEVRLPKLAPSHDASVLAPAEVEL
ncbi:DUF2760 domain-containing protein [Noviherbaspirillum aridicola]|uniref:DUF2760 domain-containing protein n=1 Tax=Noviherbaspirillum aridicola TaxID=2849687 RepID=A0ABQ4PZ92_9BURK|nr:DUF2760 domain-containing protein [Noviherbaspirillum aridicola]GIZ50221.1 hypothetical protein NCCP691_02350 [Noviherbaspirillum aridicola]